MRGLKIGYFLFVFLTAAMLTGAAAFAASLDSITICQGVEGAEGNPVKPTDKFWTYSPSFHAVAKIVDATTGTKIAAKWISVDEDGKVISTAEMGVQRKGFMNAHFELSKPDKDWSAGKYRIDIYIDGKKAGSESFTVL